MALPIYQHTVTVTADGVTPQGPFASGIAGDERAARLTFQLKFTDAAQYHYRLEVVNGAGAYDITERLTVTGGAIVQDIPAAWTAAGTAAVRLVQFTESGGVETARRYFPPVLLQFAYRDEGTGGVTAAAQWQEMLTRAEAVLDEMSQAAATALKAGEAALLAQESAEIAEEAATAAAESADTAADEATAAAKAYTERCETVHDHVESLSGITADIVSVAGPGEGIWHPCVTVDTALSAESDNPVQNKAVTAALDTKLATSKFATAITPLRERLNDIAAYVTEHGTEITADGTRFSYVKWSTGEVECWGRAVRSVMANTAKGNLYVTAEYLSFAMPEVFTDAVANAGMVYAHISQSNENGIVTGGWCSEDGSTYSCGFACVTPMTAETNVSFRIYARTIAEVT